LIGGQIFCTDVYSVPQNEAARLECLILVGNKKEDTPP